MHLSSLLIVLPTLLATTVSAAGFANSCQNCRLIINKAAAGVMGCDCRNNSGQLVSTSIHLGNCFGNQNGALVPQVGGNFVATCSVEFLSPAPGPALFLGVNCKKIDGSSVGSSLNINAVGSVTNNNGQLTC